MIASRSSGPVSGRVESGIGVAVGLVVVDDDEDESVTVMFSVQDPLETLLLLSVNTTAA